MRAFAGTARGAPIVPATLLLSAFSFLLLIPASNMPLHFVIPAVTLATVVAAFHRTIFAWRSLVAGLLLMILFIPMRRYTLPVNVSSFEIEPYRLLVAFVVAGWIGSLLVDPRVRLRRSGLEGPFLLIWISVLASIGVNGDQIAALGDPSIITKSLTFLASFFLVFYVIVSVVRYSHLDRLIKILVVGGAIVGLLGVYESRTGFNVFDQYARYVPLLQEHLIPGEVIDEGVLERGDRLRTYASAEHPIGLAAALVVLIPLGVYLAVVSGSRRWWLAVGALGLGALATVSRTGVLMLMVLVLVFLWLRPRETRRLWLALVPALVAVHFALPHTLGVLKSSFFPEEGLITEQRSSASSRTASGRVADLAPTLEQVSRKPLLGIGYGTQVVEGPSARGRILDNQWLGTLLETGILGVIGWLWLFGRFVRRASRESKSDYSPRGWLLAALTASVAAFAIAMLTFDAFAFIQVTFLLFILLGFGVIALRKAPVADKTA